MKTRMMSAKEVVDDAVRELRKRKPCLIKRGKINFYVDKPRREIVYSLAAFRCSTADEILGWCLHLSLKRWITVAHLEHFIMVASEYHKLELK